jgi:tetratricopeptide (TPR) repeat protein
MARSLNFLGMAAQHRGDYGRARLLITDSADLFRTVGDKLGLALALSNLGWTYFAEGCNDQAQLWLTEALDLAREVGSVWSISLALCYLGWVELAQGRVAEAERLLQESLVMARMQDIKMVMILARLGQAQVALGREDAVQAITYLKAAEQLRREIGITLLPSERRMAARLQQALRVPLSSPAFPAGDRARGGGPSQ